MIKKIIPYSFVLSYLLMSCSINKSIDSNARKQVEYSAISDHFKEIALAANSKSNPVLFLDTTLRNEQLKAKKPNVIIVMSDDLDAVFTPQYFPEVMPILDTLKKIGTDFSNSFTPMSICCPSRSATLTGSYAHTNGVYRNGSVNGGWRAFRHNETQTLPAYLSNAGYRTTMIGKYLNGYGEKLGYKQKDKNKESNAARPIYGWTDGAVFSKHYYYPGYNFDVLHWEGGKPINDSLWEASHQQENHHGYLPEDYSTDVVKREAIEFLNKSEEKDEQPFFMYLTPTAPHFPLQAAPRFKKMADERWRNTQPPQRPNYANDFGKLATQAEKKVPADKPSWLRKTWKKRVRQLNHGAFYYNMTFKGSVPASIKSFKQADWYSRMGSLYALNDFVKTLIDTLKAKGEWDNTLLIFTSDNGYMLGSHAMLHKGNPYEESIRVPMIIAGGDSLHLKTAGKSDEWVTNLDLMPTILDVAGIKIPDRVEGLSIAPLLFKDSVIKHRDRFVMEYLGPGMLTDKMIPHSRFFIKMAPLFVLDHPTFNAIRMKIQINEKGVIQEKIFKYIEWQKSRDPKILNFSNQYRSNDAQLMQKIAAGDKRTLAQKNKAEEIEMELYNLTDDPYEMDNLLFYKPQEYETIKLQMKAAMRDIILKK